MLYTIFVGFDLPVEFLHTTAAQLPYQFETFLALGLILFIINVRRSIRRWMGMSLVSKIAKFQFNSEVSEERKRRIITYNLLEALVMAAVAYGLYTLTNKAWMPAIGLLFCTLDNIIFTVVGIRGKKYRVGVTSKAVMLADRDVQVIYYTGLRKVSIHQQSIYFDYIKNLQLDIPTDCVPVEKANDFFATIENNVDKDRVFFSKTK